MAEKKKQMTRWEIDEALALKIGYLPKHIRAARHGVIEVCSRNSPLLGLRDEMWVAFSHMDPTVIWPLAKTYRAFPYVLRDREDRHNGQWCIQGEGSREWISYDPEKCVALAVIEGGVRY